LPCNAEAKVLVRKHGYFGVARPVTPTADPGDLKVELSRAVYQLKVSSTPAGAAGTGNGKAGGGTPTTGEGTAVEPTTIVMTKDGYSTETQKLTPKSNNQTVHVALKKKLR